MDYGVATIGGKDYARAVSYGQPVLWLEAIADMMGKRPSQVSGYYYYIKDQFTDKDTFLLRLSECKEAGVPHLCADKKSTQGTKRRVFTESGFNKICQYTKQNALMHEVSAKYFNVHAPTPTEESDDDKILGIAEQIVRQAKEIKELRDSNVRLIAIINTLRQAMSSIWAIASEHGADNG